MQEIEDYKWNVRQDTSFEGMMSYAWYLYIENKSALKREEATSCLKMINLAAGIVGIERIPISQISIAQLAEIKSVFRDDKVSPIGANKAIMQFLKFLDILREREIININLIDIAAQL